MNWDHSNDCIPPDWVPPHERPREPDTGDHTRWAGGPEKIGGVSDGRPADIDFHFTPDGGYTNPERNTMSTGSNFTDDLERIRASFNAQIDALAAEVRASELPPEPYQDKLDWHVLVVFTKRFGNAGGTEYTYAAIRPAGRRSWSVTGKENLTSVPWKRLADFIVQDEGGLAGVARASIKVTWVVA